MPADRTAVDYHEDKYHEQRHGDLIESDLLQRAWSEYAALTYFGDLQGASEIFEFGGALGYNLRHLVRKHSCHLLELSSLGRQNAQTLGIRVYAHEEEVHGRFDVVLCRHVLEHVDHPLKTLAYLKEKTKESGRIVLVLPVESNRAAPVDSELDFHLYCWNPRTISNLLTQAGLRMSSYRYNYFNGRRFALPLYKSFGAQAYARALNVMGHVRNSAELVVEVKHSDG